jgi:hypothetical protein
MLAVMRRAVVDVLQKRGLWVMVFKESTHACLQRLLCAADPAHSTESIEFMYCKTCAVKRRSSTRVVVFKENTTATPSTPALRRSCVQHRVIRRKHGVDVLRKEDSTRCRQFD